MAASITMSVSQINDYAAKLVARDFLLKNVRVSGEAANVKCHVSGHLYLSLNDENSSIRCFIPAENVDEIGFIPQDGDKLTIIGSVGIYRQAGQFQIVGRAIEKQGEGELYKRFIQLKRKLESEGLFDLSKKERIPMYPRAIGVITSESGSVLHDIINVTKRRFPDMNLVLYPVTVQGAMATDDIIRALDIAQSDRKCDVLIIARGGGSMEDISTFNDESLVRAIVKCSIPTVSAVGHETDYTLSDYAADLRAPTPSAAAEICVPMQESIVSKIDGSVRDMNQYVQSRILTTDYRLQSLTAAVSTDAMTEHLNNEIRHIDSLCDIMKMCVESKIDTLDSNIKGLNESIEALSPVNVMSRGYAMIEHNGHYVSEYSDIKHGDEIFIHMKDGTHEAVIVDRR